MTDEQKELRGGKFTASRGSDLLAGGTGATRLSYIYDVAASFMGCMDNIETAEMRHGIVNQHNAFKLVVKPMFKDAIWYDQYMQINDNCGASADVYLGDGIPLDVKCPTSVDSYSNEIHKYSTLSDSTNAGYYVQSQIQMLTTDAPIGLLLFYLTKFETYMQEDWREYAVPLHDRYKLIEFKRNVELQDAWLKAVDEAAIRRDRIIELMQSATVMDEAEFFYVQTKFNKLVPAKKASNHLNINYIKIGNKFYYERK